MCSQSELSKLLSAFVLKSQEHFGKSLKSIILFGSYARGDFDDESDVDIALIFDIPRERESSLNSAIADIVSEIDEQFSYAVLLSPLVISYSFFQEWKNTLPFYKNLTEEGVRLIA